MALFVNATTTTGCQKQPSSTFHFFTTPVTTTSLPCNSLTIKKNYYYHIHRKSTISNSIYHHQPINKCCFNPKNHSLSKYQNIHYIK